MTLKPFCVRQRRAYARPLQGRIRLWKIICSFLCTSVVMMGCGTAKVASSEERVTSKPSLPVTQYSLLIAQLGSDDWDTRDAAQKALEDWPLNKLSEIEPVLQTAARSEDPEVKMRATAILKKIHPFTLLGTNPQGYKEYRHEATGLVFVLIPGGTFRMGSNDGPDNEKPVHEVAVRDFFIAKYKVTQAVWEKVMGHNLSQFKGTDNPVETVSWNDCDAFCHKTGLRLPTEAEWEYAARGGTTTRFYWGDDEKIAGDYAWYGANSGGTTHPVGQKKPNGYGLYDIAGNVWEWCADWYNDEYYKNSPKDNPTGPANGKYKGVRGGDWDVTATDLRVSGRINAGWADAGRYDVVGFRPARTK